MMLIGLHLKSMVQYSCQLRAAVVVLLSTMMVASVSIGQHLAILIAHAICTSTTVHYTLVQIGTQTAAMDLLFA